MQFYVTVNKKKDKLRLNFHIDRYSTIITISQHKN